MDTIILFLEQNPCTIFFVNDGSRDNTLVLLQEIKSLFPNKVETINLNRNSGKGEAVRQGFLAAISTKRFDYIGYLDADLATPLEEIHYLLKHLDQHIKIVIGSRIKRLGAVIERDPLRHYLGRIFATLASMVLDIKVYDSQCGAKIFDRAMAKKLFAKSFESKWLFDLELLYRLKKENSLEFHQCIVEVPLRKWQEKGSSKVKLIDFFAAPFELFRIKRTTKGL